MTHRLETPASGHRRQVPGRTPGHRRCRLADAAANDATPQAPPHSPARSAHALLSVAMVARPRPFKRCSQRVRRARANNEPHHRSLIGRRKRSRGRDERLASCRHPARCLQRGVMLRAHRPVVDLTRTRCVFCGNTRTHRDLRLRRRFAPTLTWGNRPRCPDRRDRCGVRGPDAVSGCGTGCRRRHRVRQQHGEDGYGG